MLVTLFKVARFQTNNNTQGEPQFDQMDLKKEHTQLATLIIRQHVEKQDDVYYAFWFTVEKDNFAQDTIEYLKKYVPEIY